MILGAKLKLAIEQSQFSTEDVAEKIEMSAANLYKLYKKDSFEIKYLYQIAEVLNLPLEHFLYDQVAEERASYNTVQGGIGNQAGNNNKQKIMPSVHPDTATESSQSKIDRLTYELILCRNDKTSLEEKLKLKDEIIELLKKKP